jgi:hypothetical protein
MKVHTAAMVRYFNAVRELYLREQHNDHVWKNLDNPVMTTTTS